ncbi:MAG TPA: MFS transporter [Pseudonocardia sp.]|jgi:MHS family alpha-ketoglutarate permease-like MFS transporter|nr:MFS transporter [Pseudonocardia sp.]
MTRPSPTETAAPGAAGPTKASATGAIGGRGAALGIGAGNLLEGFDWGSYALFAPFFAAQIFGGHDPAAALLASLAVFAVGFVARPVGAVLFGRLADRVGRRPVLALTIGSVALGCLLIGLCPTHDRAGILAPAVLLVARLLQGLGHGGELPTAQTYLTELAPREHRGLWSSLSYVSGSIGGLAGSALGAVLAGALGPEAMNTVGWRVPFLLGAALGLFALVIRVRLPESAVFAQRPEGERQPSLAGGLRAVPSALARVVGLTAGITVVYYTWSSNTVAYAITARHLAPGPALWAFTGGLAVFLLALPVWGALSDRIGRRPALLLAGVPLTVLLVPLDRLADGGPWSLFAATAIALGLLACPLSAGIAVYAELFPTGVRAAGLGLPYAVTVALFGGTAPYLQTWLDHTGRPALFDYYSVAAMVLTLLTVWSLPETRALDLRMVPLSGVRRQARPAMGRGG